MKPIRSWLSPTDYQILSILSETGLWLSPTCIHANIRDSTSRDHVGRRLRLLDKTALLKHKQKGYYATTDLGDKAMRGGLSEAEWDDLERERDY
jgi:repressor of nif and glnA expression